MSVFALGVLGGSQTGKLQRFPVPAERKEAILCDGHDPPYTLTPTHYAPDSCFIYIRMKRDTSPCFVPLANCGFIVTSSSSYNVSCSRETSKRKLLPLETLPINVV